MKKVALILLVLIYSASSFGITLKEFYCCGKLKSVSLALTDLGKNKCEMGDEKDGCCKTKYHYFKVKDTHLATDQLTVPANLHITLALPVFANVPASLFTRELNVINGSHAPPPHQYIPAYISNCVFRI